jgi:energy-coupling factor transport system ATP-binding protein
MIQIERLRVAYGQQAVLRDLTLDIEEGTIVLLTGASGCGKTSLARVLSGLIPHAIPALVSGNARVAGREVAACTIPELATRVGLILQNPSAQLFNTTVEEEVAFGPRNLGMGASEVHRRSQWALEAMEISHLRDRPVRELSGGEQQLVVIAATLAMRPTVLILDEPTSNLDLWGTHRLIAALQHLRNAYGITILIIEHRPERFTSLPDRVLLMDRGQIVADGPPEQVFAQKTLLTRLGIRYPWKTFEQHWEDILPQGIESSGQVDRKLVELTGVTAGYHSREVLKGIDLSLSAGGLAALVGKNGAGKTTLGRVFTGLLRPRRGQIRWTKSQGQAPHVGFVLQNPLAQLFCDTVEEEIAFGPRNFGRYSPEQIQSLLKEADLLDLRARSTLQLSSGQQQRLAVAAVAALKPSLLIVDEPTLGQDWGHLSRTMEFLLDLNNQGTAILLITHDVKLICRYIPRMIVLQEGCIVADGPPRRPSALGHPRADRPRTIQIKESTHEST